MTDPYKPVACDFYDQLEVATTFQREVKITYINEGKPLTQGELIISELQTISGVEFVEFTNGLILRLDQILSFESFPMVAKN